MTSDALLVVECLFDTIWQLFTSWHIPGTSISPAMCFMFYAAANISLRFFLQFLHSPNASAQDVAESVKSIRGHGESGNGIGGRTKMLGDGR